MELNSAYLCVKDMKRAVDFYENFLDQKVTEYDDVLSVLDFGFRLCLFNYKAVGESVSFGDNCVLSFEVEDIQSTIEKVEKLGAEIVFPMTRIKENWVFEFKDTEGNDVEIYSNCQTG